MNCIPNHLICFTTTNAPFILARHFKDLFGHKCTLPNKRTEVDQSEIITSKHKTLHYHYTTVSSPHMLGSTLST